MTNVNLKVLFRSRGLTLSKVAELCGVDKAAVTRWAQSRIPAERVPDVARYTGITRHELRPDIYEVGQ